MFDLNINEKYTEVYVNYNVPEILLQMGILYPEYKLKKNNLSFQFEFKPDNNVKFHFSSAIIPGEIQTKYKFSDISNVGKQTFSANYSQSQNTVGMELQFPLLEKLRLQFSTNQKERNDSFYFICKEEKECIKLKDMNTEEEEKPINQEDLEFYNLTKERI